jgi:hypothetical protein
MTTKSPFYETKVRLSDRLEENVTGFPFVAIISFGFALVFVGIVLPSLNARVGSPAQPITWEAKAQKEGAIWLAVKVVDDEILITTGDRKIFRLPKRIDSPKALEQFSKYISSTLEQEVKRAVLANEILKNELTVVISADQRLKYLHVRPVINVLAEAGITNFAFETQLMRESANAEKATHRKTEHL